MYTEQNNYLCHYGVLGMKWGRRKKPDKSGIREAKKRNKDARFYMRSINNQAPQGFTRAGAKRMLNYVDEMNRAKQKYDKTRFDLAYAKADYAKKYKGDKAAIKSLGKSMYSYGGLPGSVSDNANNNISKRLYDDIAQKKGSKYADSVLESARKKAVTTTASALTTALGAYALSAYLLYKRG